jgi:hypothetical protein
MPPTPQNSHGSQNSHKNNVVKGEAELISRARVDAMDDEQPRPEPVRRGRSDMIKKF